MLQEGDDMSPSMKKHKLDNMDLISDLPDPIFHHIMSFLTTSDVTTMSILSKRLFYLWSSFPVIDFDEKRFARGSTTPSMITNRFLDHIYKSVFLSRLDSVLFEFRVKADLNFISSDHRFDFAISFALANSVKCLDLDLGSAKYDLPTEFASKTIHVLRLKGFSLDLYKIIQGCSSLRTVSLNSCVILQDIVFSSHTLTEIEFDTCVVKLIKIKAPNLHSFSFDSGKRIPKPCCIDVSRCEDIVYLSLHNLVHGNDGWIEQLVYTLGKLETFILNRCRDIQHIRVWNKKLERVEIVNCPLLASIELMTPSLKSFVYKAADYNRVCIINFIASKYIKDLSIEGAAISDEWLETEIANLSFLESLRLKACNCLRRIRVFHEKLQILELFKCFGLVEVDIDTPEVVSFMYGGKIIQFGTMVTRSTCTATLVMDPWIDYTYESFYGWRKLLSYFGHCQTLKLICNSHKELVMPEDLRETLVQPLYDLQHLEIEIKLLEKIDSDLVDSLLWLLPLPKILRISSASPKSALQVIIKFDYNDTMEIEEEKVKKVFCCTNKLIKCWRHCLKTVEIQTSPINGLAELQAYFS